MAFRYGVLLSALAGAGVMFMACDGDAPSETTSTTTTTSAGGGAPTSSSVASSSSGGGMGPIDCAFNYTNVPTVECDLLQQDCAPGFTCKPIEGLDGWKTECKPAPGIKGANKPCLIDDECEPGLFCIGNTNPKCTPVCCPDGNAQQPCGGGTCDAEVDLDGAAGNKTMTVCAYDQECELLTENACTPPSECHISDPLQGLSTCIEPSTMQAEEGGACVYRNDCKDMQHCYNFVCRYYCYVQPPGDPPPGLGGCPPERTCTPDPTLGVAGVGLCLP